MAHQRQTSQKEKNTTGNGPSSPPFDDRTIRAAEEYLSVVTPDVTGDFFVVYSSDGTEYRVDPDLGMCECKDMHFNDPKEGCKHLRRVEFVQGERDILSLLLYDEIEPDRNLLKRLGIGETSGTDPVESNPETQGAA